MLGLVHGNSVYESKDGEGCCIRTRSRKKEPVTINEVGCSQNKHVRTFIYQLIWTPVRHRHLCKTDIFVQHPSLEQLA